MRYLLENLSDLAKRRAVNIREEAQLWDVLSRDLKRAAKEIEEQRSLRPTRPNIKHEEEAPSLEGKLYVRVKEAQKAMGIGHTSLYKEINEGRLPIKKSGSKTLIAVKDIYAWFDRLPESL